MTDLSELITEAKAERKTVATLLKQASTPTAPSATANPYRAIKGASFDKLPDAEKKDAEAGLAHFDRLGAGPIARWRNGRALYGENRPAKAHLVGFRWLGDWSFKGRVLTWLYNIERPVTEVAKAYLDILPQAEDGFSGPVADKLLATLEDKGVKRFNLQPIGDIAGTGFANSDGGFNELGLTWGRMWGDRYWLGQNTHIPEVAAAVKALDKYLPDFEKRLKTLAKGVLSSRYDPERWWLNGHALRHSTEQLCRGFLAGYLVTGRADFKAAWLHFAQNIQKEQFYGKAADGTPVCKQPHQYAFRKKELGWGGSGVGGDADLTYDQENIEAQLDRYMMGDPYVTETQLEGYGNLIILTSTPFGLGDDRMSEAQSGSYKDRSLEGKAISVLRWPDGKEEVVSVPGTSANRLTTFQNAVARRRGAHYDLTVFSKRDWLGYLQDVIEDDDSDATHIARCMVQAKRRDKKLLTRKEIKV